MEGKSTQSLHRNFHVEALLHAEDRALGMPLPSWGPPNPGRETVNSRLDARGRSLAKYMLVAWVESTAGEQMVSDPNTEPLLSWVIYLS